MGKFLKDLFVQVLIDLVENSNVIIGTLLQEIKRFLLCLLFNLQFLDIYLFFGIDEKLIFQIKSLKMSQLLTQLVIFIGVLAQIINLFQHFIKNK